MNTCSYCGEYKKIRKEINTSGEHFDFFGYIWGYQFFNYICEYCKIAQEVISKRLKLKYDNETLLRQKAWRKERDKIIKQMKGGKNDKE